MPETPQSLTLIAKAESIGPATEFIRKGAREAQLPESRFGELDLVIEEILMNVSRYAYREGPPGIVEISYSIPMPGELALDVSDQGVEFDPLVACAPDLTLDLAQRPVGGLGIHLLRSFAKSLSYRRDEGRNRLTFRISANS